MSERLGAAAVLLGRHVGSTQEPDRRLSANELQLHLVRNYPAVQSPVLLYCDREYT